MNYAQLTAYLQGYLQSNDAGVINNIPNFMSLAASRIRTDLRTALIEHAIQLLSVASQPIPAGFIAVRLINVNGIPQTWISPKQLSEGESGFTISAQNIIINPEPLSTDIIGMTYYVINQNDEMAANIPHLMVHCAAAEAEMWQGDGAAAAFELKLYENDKESNNGWDFHGSISMGGGMPSATGTGTTSGGGGGAVPVPTYSTLDSLTDVTITAPTNAQALIFNSATNQWVNADQSGGGGGGMSPSNALPIMDGVASAGTSGLASRGDHVHPSDTSKASSSDLSGHINNASTAHAATAITSVPSGNLSATNVGAALNELQSDIDTRAALGTNSDITSMTALTNITAATVAVDLLNDVVFIGDASDSGKIKKVTASSISGGGGATITVMPQITLSGNSVDIAIPAGVVEFSVNFNQPKTGGTSPPMIQLGTASSVEATGYLGTGFSSTAAGGVLLAATTGCLLAGSWSSTTSFVGTITGKLIDAATNTWILSGNGANTPTANTFNSGSVKPLAGALTRIRITTVAGNQAFSSGNANVIHVIP